MSEVAVLGTGRMGSAMARRLVGAGHRVRLYNRTTAIAQALATELGAEFAADPALAVTGADVVISVLATGAATEAVLLDASLLEALDPNTVVCDMATSGVETARRVARVYAEHGRRFVDAPVSGSVATVEAGALLVLGSGAPEDVAAVGPTLAAFAKRVIDLGDAGAGQAMKLCVNLVVHALNAAVSEGLALATAAGVAPESAYDVFEQSVVAAPFVVYKRPAFLSESAPVAMSLDLTAKDLGLITEFAHALGLEARVADATRAAVADACASGRGAEDMAALVRHLAPKGRAS